MSTTPMSTRTDSAPIEPPAPPAPQPARADGLQTEPMEEDERISGWLHAGLGLEVG